MNWSEVCEHPALRDLPFKVETDQWGNIVMSPAQVAHSIFQTRITNWFNGRHGGEALVELAIETADGVKVPDLVWATSDYIQKMKHVLAATRAPLICIEVMSPGNSTAQMRAKRDLYFGAGAQEVWVCSTTGTISFYSQNAQLETSDLFPDFPNQFSI